MTNLTMARPQFYELLSKTNNNKKEGNCFFPILLKKENFFIPLLYLQGKLNKL